MVIIDTACDYESYYEIMRANVPTIQDWQHSLDNTSALQIYGIACYTFYFRLIIRTYGAYCLYLYVQDTDGMYIYIYMIIVRLST